MQPLESVSINCGLSNLSITSQVKLNNLSQNSNSWLWNFGNGDTSTKQNPIYIYPSPGVYQVMLIAYNAQGCPDTAIKNLYVAEESFIKLPTAYTPNQDNVNDKLFLHYSGIESLEEFKIFNRWGELVYSSRDLKRGWDGTSNGVPQDEGTFTYYIVAKASVTKKKIFQKGTFVLIR